jgi:hypothetical protein
MLSTFSIHRGQLASKEAEERPQVERFYTRSKPRGGAVTVLAGGTSAEELIEGLSIGVGAVIKPGFALLIALAIIIDNLAESLSIGEIIRSERDGHKRREVWRILGWSGLIGFALLISALTLGGFFLKGLSEPVLGFLFGLGGGGILYPTISDLLPDAEERHINNRRRLRWQTDSYLSLYFPSSCEDRMRRDAARCAWVSFFDAHDGRRGQCYCLNTTANSLTDYGQVSGCRREHHPSTTLRNSIRHNARQQRERGEIFVCPAMSLRDNFMADDEEHGTGGNPEDDRNGRLGEPYGPSAENSAHRFDETGQTRNP